jgi:hypothetical protein
MQYKPILDAIEAIIKADETANGLIGVYRTYGVEPGVPKTPICVIGASTEMSHDQGFFGPHSGARPVLWKVAIVLLILGRCYKTQIQLITEVEKLDATQAAVYTALNEDSTITNTVTLSVINSIQDITLPGGEYFGHKITIEADKKET